MQMACRAADTCAPREQQLPHLSAACCACSRIGNTEPPPPTLPAVTGASQPSRSAKASPHFGAASSRQSVLGWRPHHAGRPCGLRQAARGSSAGAQAALCACSKGSQGLRLSWSVICARVSYQGLRLAGTRAAWAVACPAVEQWINPPKPALPVQQANPSTLCAAWHAPCSLVLPVPLHAAAMPLTGCTVVEATTESLNVAAMQKTCGVNTQRWMQTLEAMPRLQSALQELESEGVRLGVKAVAAEAEDASGGPQGFKLGWPACQQMSAAASVLQQQQTHARPAR